MILVLVLLFFVAAIIGKKIEERDFKKELAAREKAINLLGYVPDTIMFGHFHHLEVNDDNGTDIVVNGSVMGSDSYAVKRRLNTPPYQVMQIYDGEDVCTYKIIL